MRWARDKNFSLSRCREPVVRNKRSTSVFLPQRNIEPEFSQSKTPIRARARYRRAIHQFQFRE
jgi:hypothetical protein